MRYFTNCKTAEELKKAYRKEAIKLHPDNGGDADAFKRMQAEYETAWERLKDVHTTKDGNTYTSQESTSEAASEYMNIIDQLLHMTGVNIEIIGSWIWLTGNTMIWKDEIKALHFFWSKSKKAWYYNGNTKKTRRRGHYKLDTIREMYGSTEIKKEDSKKRISA